MVEAVVADFGGLDIVVNNAGIWLDHKLDEVEYDEWQQAWRSILDTNLLGPANVCYCAARHMIKNSCGGRTSTSRRVGHSAESPTVRPTAPARPGSTP